MGIDNFHKWISITYPECIIKPQKEYDHVYIDINYVLHKLINKDTDEKKQRDNL